MEVIVVGSFVQDLAFRTNTFPKPGETRIGSFKMGPGGKGFNQAIACSRLEQETLFLGAVGNDSFFRDLVEFLKDEELNTKFQTIDNQATGTASIVVDDSGQNLIVVALGANDFLSPKFIAEQSDSFKKSKVVIAQLESNIEATLKAFELGRKSGAKLLLNPAPINSQVNRELIELADILLPNETEAGFLLEHLHNIKPAIGMVESDSDLATISRKLSPHTVIITLGDKGVFVSPPEAKPYRVPAIKAKTVDTTGAGDAFCGGLAAGLLRFPDSLEWAVRFANTVAGLSTEISGTAPAMPKLKVVLNKIED